MTRKAIAVKVSTVKVINALEASLNKLEKAYSSQAENEAKHEKLTEKYNKELVKFAVARIGKAENLRASYRAWNGTLNLDFDLTGLKETDLPVEPEKDFEAIHQHTYREQKEELSNAIRILKMTDEELVSASTFSSVAKYL